MSNVELPHPLEAYFAHAELPAGAERRRFTITLPYFDEGRLDRLQWWWTVSAAQQRLGGEEGLSQLRREATLRFRQHIEHWLFTHQRVLQGEGPIPQLRSLSQRVAAAAVEAPPAVSPPDLRLVSNR